MPVPEGERQMAGALHDARTEVVALRESLEAARGALREISDLDGAYGETTEAGELARAALAGEEADTGDGER